MGRLTRRGFLHAATMGVGAMAMTREVRGDGGEAALGGFIRTVMGPVPAAELGPALTHEHVMVDFIGAAEVSPDRYDADEVFEVMRPYCIALREAGIDALFECTPEYIGRDPALLRRLSEATGLTLITNTGFYKAPFLPERALTATVDELAAHWIDEARHGIGDTGILPGFIKIAANEGELIDVQRRIARAAARASLATGLTIASHTTTGIAAMQELDILEEEGLPLSRFIVVHSDAEPGRAFHQRTAERGAWVSYDGIREGNAAERVPLVMAALAEFPERLLISQDAGWYNVGQERGGDVVAWDWLPRAFVPLLREAGASEADVARLLVENPARAFAVDAALPA
jgi:predicted metal-dependent phosphotriesterase family hydrolase